MNLSNISVVLPSLDPDKKLQLVIDGLLEYGFTDIILVNDGSKPENMHYFEAAAQHPQVHLLHHKVNRGKGAALKTAFAWFLENRPDAAGVVTVDGDNQHHPEDTRNCCLQMLKKQRMVLGVRDFSLPDVPPRSRAGNKITSFVFKVFVGMKISDTQTGLRAIPRDKLKMLLSIDGDRFEYETNMLLAMKTHNIAFDEVKIRTVYIEENKSSHFRAFRDSWRIYKLIFAHFFKYTLSSLLCSFVDEGLFIYLSHLLCNTLSGFLLTAVPILISRLISSVMNFFVNRRLVFHSHLNLRKAFFRYFSLVIPQGVLQLGITFGLYELFQISAQRTLVRGGVHALVMIALFFVSYTIQQRWVFSGTEEDQ